MRDQYPNKAVAAVCTPGVDVVRNHRNVVDFRLGPGQTLIFKFYDSSFEVIRKLGLEAESKAPDAWAANRLALAEQVRLLSNPVAQPPKKLAVCGVVLGKGVYYEIFQPPDRGFPRHPSLRFKIGDLGAPIQAVKIVGRSESGVAGVVSSLTEALGMWFSEKGSGRVVEIRPVKTAATVAWSAGSNDVADVLISVAVMLCAHGEKLNSVEVHSPPNFEEVRA